MRFGDSFDMRTISVTAVSAAALSCVCVLPAMAAPETPIYSFLDSNDGGFPQGGVIADGKGNFYGTTTSGGAGHNGVVYELSPPASGGKSWTQKTLYAFSGGKDGGNPQAGLMIDAKGALFGTTYAGGGKKGEGVVFKLVPPAKGASAWTEAVLWQFSGGNDGGEPSGTLIMDKSGNIYGTTTTGGTGAVGTVFELSPPRAGAHGWTETVLYNFTGNNDGGEPFGRVLLASDGNLYGTTAGYGQYDYGTLYRLTAPVTGVGPWGFAVLHAFAGGTDGEVPRDGLIEGQNGELFGTTAGFDTSYGNVFTINADGTGYKVLWTVKGGQGFTGNGPWQTVALDSSGALYGATLADGKSASGEVFKLTPPVAGKKVWTSQVLHVFQPNAGGEIAYTTVLVGNGFLYGTTYGFAGESGFYPGTVWQIKN